MQVLIVNSTNARFIGEAAERTAPDGKVVVLGPDGEALGRLAPLGFDHLVLETSPAGQVPLPDHSIDRAFLVMGLREMKSLDRTVQEVHRVIKPEGQFIVHRRFLFAGLLQQRLVSACADIGFDLVASHEALFHYTLTFAKHHHEHLDPN
jgi:ubiquinone/menaquinone biosynthesis C-methylase UbiE